MHAHTTALTAKSFQASERFSATSTLPFRRSFAALLRIFRRHADHDVPRRLETFIHRLELADYRQTLCLVSNAPEDAVLLVLRFVGKVELSGEHSLAILHHRKVIVPRAPSVESRLDRAETVFPLVIRRDLSVALKLRIALLSTRGTFAVDVAAMMIRLPELDDRILEWLSKTLSRPTECSCRWMSFLCALPDTSWSGLSREFANA